MNERDSARDDRPTGNESYLPTPQAFGHAILSIARSRTLLALACVLFFVCAGCSGSATGEPSKDLADDAPWPDASNTGTTNCPNLERVNNGDQIVIDKDNTVYENKGTTSTT